MRPVRCKTVRIRKIRSGSGMGASCDRLVGFCPYAFHRFQNQGSLRALAQNVAARPAKKSQQVARKIVGTNGCL